MGQKLRDVINERPLKSNVMLNDVILIFLGLRDCHLARAVLAFLATAAAAAWF